MLNVQDLRRANAARLLHEKWGGVKAVMAADLGVQGSYVTRMLKPGAVGGREIGNDMARRIEVSAGKPENWLDQNHNQDAAPNLAPAGGAMKGRVPVVSWVIAGEWAEIDDPQQLPPEDYEWIETSDDLSALSAIALRVEGTSMFDPANRDSFEPGCIVVVQSVERREPRSGDFVVVRLENQRRATFKQLILDGDDMYLKPLNPDLPVMRVREEATIVGVVVEKIVRKRY
jgi:SOS-response transcriptional repressor LexA